MTVKIGQVYRDEDPRMEGRTLRVTKVDDSDPGATAVLETVTNPTDIQRLLDDPEPGTRSYTPQDRRGKTTVISVARLEGDDYGLVEEPPTIEGPV